MLSFIQGLFKRPNVVEKPHIQIVPDLSLYHFTGCPFCRSVRKQISFLGLEIEQRNVYSNEDYMEELLQNGGKRTVPCLRIEHADGSVQWMYESMDIIAYLKKRFG